MNRGSQHIWAVFRFLPEETKSSNIFGAYASEKLADEKAEEFNRRFADDEFEYRVLPLPILNK